jgi:hypothetical protein
MPSLHELLLKLFKTPNRWAIARCTLKQRHTIAIVIWCSSKEKDNHPGCSQQEDYLQMCDYSLHNFASRPAKVGDKLVTTKFDFLTRGFAAIGEPNVAVCLLPGTEVAFDCEVERDHPFGRALPSMQFGKLGDKVARFRQVNMDRPNVHHDALEFPDGQIVLVTRLCEGQRATVLQLPASPRVTCEAQEQMHASAVA